MMETVTTPAIPAPRDDPRAVTPAGAILRDIARGGIAGIIVGVFVAGIGGRIVMRLATILHEEAVGLHTEQDAIIGAMTFNGTMALITFGGLGMGLLAGTIWVIVNPWIPGRGLGRAAITAAMAVALGTPSLIQRSNLDFLILDHDARVVGLLIVLVAAVGFSIALVDGALDRRLPPARQGAGTATVVYLIVTLLGLVLIFPLVIGILLREPRYGAEIRAGWAVFIVGLCSLTWWCLRIKARAAPPPWLTLTGRAALVAAVVLGIATSLPHVRGALGMSP